MKFAKLLQQEVRQEWDGQYVDYKQMKKVLKGAERDDVVAHFCMLLESQLEKVHAFMRGQQEAIVEDICPLELQVRGTENENVRIPSSVGSLDNHCMQLVENIQHFQSYAALNQMAVRKIIKKFDKRFQVRFHDQIALPELTRLRVSKSDIGEWLLAPARNCLRLMRGTIGLQRGHVERPLRQFNFWVEELKAGAQLARLHVNGSVPSRAGPTPLRLRLLGDREELQLCIRNTFIHFESADDRRSSHRSNSQPARLRLALCEQNQEPQEIEAREVPIMSLERLLCEELGVSPPSRVFDSPDTDEEEELFGTPRRVQTFELSSLPRSKGLPGHEGHCGKRVGSTTPPFPDLVEEEDYEEGWSRRGTVMSSEGSRPRASREVPPHLEDVGDEDYLDLDHQAKNRSKTWRTPPAPLSSPSRSPGGQSSMPSSPSRWWTEVTEVCPLSGFPVALLPYPPFKLQAPVKGAKDSSRLVDGPFLVLQVLSNWQFDVLGQPLTIADINALDTYMKRCKLGPFRLGRALELMSDNSPKAHEELESLRQRARRRLEGLKHIQRVRLSRGEAQWSQGVGGGTPAGGRPSGDRRGERRWQGHGQDGGSSPETRTQRGEGGRLRPSWPCR